MKWASTEKVYMAADSLFCSDGTLKDYLDSRSRAAIIINQIRDRNLIHALTKNLDPVAITVHANSGYYVTLKRNARHGVFFKSLNTLRSRFSI